MRQPYCFWPPIKRPLVKEYTPLLGKNRVFPLQGFYSFSWLSLCNYHFFPHPDFLLYKVSMNFTAPVTHQVQGWEGGKMVAEQRDPQISRRGATIFPGPSRPCPLSWTQKTIGAIPCPIVCRANLVVTTNPLWFTV
jgi:hypothetical protein